MMRIWRWHGAMDGAAFWDGLPGCASALADEGDGAKLGMTGSRFSGTRAEGKFKWL